jgi:hypothetical protein
VAKVTHIGGRMYGDGEYVVEFTSSTPLKATVLGPGLSGGFAEVTFAPSETKPTLGLAAQAIGSIRKAVA